MATTLVAADLEGMLTGPLAIRVMTFRTARQEHASLDLLERLDPLRGGRHRRHG